jgi:hypothetical protein
MSPANLAEAARRAAEAHCSEIIDVRVTDPETGMPWPHFMDTGTVQRFLRGLGIKISMQTLAHKRSRGIGIRWRYQGQRPVATQDEVRRHIREELLGDSSPLAGKRGWRSAANKTAG